MNTRHCTLGFLAFAISLGAAGVSLATPPGVVYHLRPGSTVQEGCSGLCACALYPAEPLRGTFVLSESAPDPDSRNFTIDDARFRAPTLQQMFAGSGTYSYADAQPGSENVYLRMSINSDSPLEWFGGRRVHPNTAPILEFAASLPGNCYNIAMIIRATPFVSDWNADGSITTADVFDFLSSWLSGDGDANDDGQIAIDDIFAFINAWMAGV